jgi:hypothetical protein
MSNAINLGDTVSGSYYGTAYTGVARGFSGAGTLLVTVPAEWTHRGRNYDGLIAVDLRSTPPEAMPRLVARGQVADILVDQGNVWTS